MTEVVKCSIDKGIAIVQMIEQEGRNTFTERLLEGLMTVFADLGQNQTVKTVIIHGFDNYFCCGGTQKELLQIFNGEIQFSDLAFYRLLLDAEIPTIAAMSGHAVGGGLAFGCFADTIIMAEEAIYTTNFMKYGFTPGMGATYMIPRKLGEVIGHEMLYSAETYQGAVLKNKGVAVPVVKKQDVMAHALELAKKLADKPRDSLKILKAHLTQEIRQKIPTIIEQELAMHKATFANPEVKERILNMYGN